MADEQPKKEEPTKQAPLPPERLSRFLQEDDPDEMVIRDAEGNVIFGHPQQEPKKKPDDVA